MNKSGSALAWMLVSWLLAGASAAAQDDEEAEEEPSITLNAMIKAQGGLFVPLASDGFEAHENEAYSRSNPLFVDGKCDPIVTPSKPCYPADHGKKAGSPSIARATLQLEGHWDFTEKLALHTII